MDGIQIRRMRANDLGAACKVLGLAFADNPNTLVVARGDRARAQRMTASGARFAKLGRHYSHVLVGEDKGRVVGVLNAIAWPSCQLRLSEKLKLAPSMIWVTGLGLPRAFTMMRVWAKHDPGERHWRLGPIGVHPELQGRGIGKALLARSSTWPMPRAHLPIWKPMSTGTWPCTNGSGSRSSTRRISPA